MNSHKKKKNFLQTIDNEFETFQLCAMDYKVNERKRSLCLECGNQIRYGRTDKKFCCEDCRTRHHNNMAKAGRAFRNKVIGILNRNYEILDSLLEKGMDSAELVDIEMMGFVPGMSTSCRRSGKHNVFTCYDIKYILTRTKIFSIMKINNLSVTLQVGTELKDQ